MSDPQTNQGFPVLNRWLGINLLDRLRRVRSYLTIPSYNNTAFSAWNAKFSEKVIQFNYSSTNNIALKPSKSTTAILNSSGLCWTVANVIANPGSALNNVVRYKLNSGLGELLNVDLYVGQTILGKYFQLEGWNTPQLVASSNLVSGGQVINQGGIYTTIIIISGFVVGQTYNYVKGNSSLIASGTTYSGLFVPAGIITNASGSFVAVSSIYVLFATTIGATPSTAIISLTGVGGSFTIPTSVLGDVDRRNGIDYQLTPNAVVVTNFQNNNPNAINTFNLPVLFNLDNINGIN